MSSITDILAIIVGIINLEKQVAEQIAKEKDVARREKLKKAFKDRDLNAIRDLLFDTY